MKKKFTKQQLLDRNYNSCFVCKKFFGVNEKVIVLEKAVTLERTTYKPQVVDINYVSDCEFPDWLLQRTVHEECFFVSVGTEWKF